MKLYVYLSWLVAGLSVGSSSITVTLPSGKYNGEEAMTYNNVTFLFFKGIKYGNITQRFKEAQMIKESNEEFNATSFAPHCSQMIGSNMIGVEDCLYLDVYTPQVNGSIPVIVFIHGGSFIATLPPRIKPDYFMETSKVVIITIYYRLGPFGFLYLDDKNYPANLGIRDQILALKWMKQNVRNFGGDPERVTIAGQSAGAASVSILTRSPATKGLFIGAISQSGTSCSLWAVQPRCTGLERLRFFAKNIGCSQHLPVGSGSSDKIVECLRNKTAEEMLKAAMALPIYMKTVPFPPIREPTSVSNPVITEYPWIEPANSSNIVPWITGVNSVEGLTLVPIMLPKSAIEMELFKAGIPVFLSDILMYKYTSSNSNFVTSRIISKNFLIYISNLEQFLIKVVSEVSFYFPESQCLRRTRSPTYSYYFNYLSSNLSNQTGVGHGQELYYMWPSSLKIRQNGSQKDKEISEFIVNTWINFSYYQNVSNPNATWERYDSERDNVLFIDNQGIKMGTNPYQQSNSFYAGLPISDKPKDSMCFLS